MVELEKNPYFFLINHPGQEVRASNVDRYAEYSWSAIDQLMKEGRVYSQKLMFEEDSLLFYIGSPVIKINPLDRALRECIAIDRQIRNK